MVALTGVQDQVVMELAAGTTPAALEVDARRSPRHPQGRRHGPHGSAPRPHHRRRRSHPGGRRGAVSERGAQVQSVEGAAAGPRNGLPDHDRSSPAGAS
ncbi:MAG: hypothetical protein R2705_11420 [Ilumatobacteraceae bacterium]